MRVMPITLARNTFDMSTVIAIFDDLVSPDVDHASRTVRR
jgi:hypothetical protein